MDAVNDLSSVVSTDLAAAFRKHLPDLSQPRFTTAMRQTPYEYTEAFQKNQTPPWLYNLTETWKELLAEPYIGVTNDGNVRPSLFHDEELGFDTAKIVDATAHLLKKLMPSQAAQLRYPLNAREWRCWSNPEFLLRPLGLRLEEMPADAAQAVLNIVEASFSPEGYQKARAAMRINHFLGECCGVPAIMNEYSYNFLLFGTPSLGSPWGWSLYGHHLCLNVFFKGSNIVISPCFTGAEPNLIDSGPWSGTAILHTEGVLALRLMQSLPSASRSFAQTYELLRDPRMLQTGDLTRDRWNRDDQRHLCGAFRDNRIVPYQGVCASTFDGEQRTLLLRIVHEFLLYYPSQARQSRCDLVARHLDETFFSWIGKYGDDDAFYFRIQSPVVLLEFDHHSGVFLTNQEPMKFHTHTIIRMPNAGDYGQAWREEGERVP